VFLTSASAAPSQHLLKPLFWCKTIYNYGQRSQEVEIIQFPFLFADTESGRQCTLLQNQLEHMLQDVQKM
jgi:hypothetical protein